MRQFVELRIGVEKHQKPRYGHDQKATDGQGGGVFAKRGHGAPLAWNRVSPSRGRTEEVALTRAHCQASSIHTPRVETWLIRSPLQVPSQVFAFIFEKEKKWQKLDFTGFCGRKSRRKSHIYYPHCVRRSCVFRDCIPEVCAVKFKGVK